MSTIERNYLYDFTESLRSLVAIVCIRLIVVDPTAFSAENSGKHQQEESVVAGNRINLHISQTSP
jgi:hypothetical protein